MKCLKVCEANKLDEIVYFIINPMNIFISALDTLHNYTSRSGNCSVILVLGNVSSNLSYQITSNQIPMRLDGTLCSNYDKQPPEGIHLPLI